jgi:hypothetical protein
MHIFYTIVASEKEAQEYESPLLQNVVVVIPMQWTSEFIASPLGLV